MKIKYITIVVGVLLSIVPSALIACGIEKHPKDIKDRYGRIVYRVDKKNNFSDYYGRRQFQFKSTKSGVQIQDRNGRRIP